MLKLVVAGDSEFSHKILAMASILRNKKIEKEIKSFILEFVYILEHSFCF
jgi:hypothetical protein